MVERMRSAIITTKPNGAKHRQRHNKIELALCEQCRELTVESLQDGFHIGTSCELRRRSGNCHLCQLISSKLDFPGMDVSKSFRIRLRDVSGSIPFPDRHSRLENATPTSGSSRTPPLTFIACEANTGATWFEVALLRLFAHEGSLSAIRGIINGRPILRPDSATNVNRMRCWLARCLESHPICRRAISGIRIDNADKSTLPSRVLYIGTQTSPQLRLFTPCGHPASYAALSYCWGTDVEARPLKLLKANVVDFSKCIEEVDIPLTIRQAIDVTRILGLNYLWVDSLCILQDDEDDWRKESQRMGKIFQNATCTIAATSARHCNEGLFLGREVDTKHAKTPYTSGDFVRIPCNKTDQPLGDMYIGTIRERDRGHLDFDNEVNRSRWKTRAWVVQERILSRRILHFGKKQLRWECQETLYSESNSEPIPTDMRLQSKKAMFHRITKESMLCKRLVQTHYTLDTVYSLLCLLKHKVQYELGVKMDIPAEAAMQRSWERIVGIYNVCQLQRETDKLPGIMGLAREMATMSGKTFCAGVWLEDIARGLYWSAAKHGEGYRSLQRQYSTGAPSWSWVGWSGPIVMGSFVAECDNGRPWVSRRTFSAAVKNDGREIELFAHFWHGVVTKKLTSGPYSVSDWKTDAWWKFRPFRISLDEQLQDFHRFELEIQPGTSIDDTIRGWFVPDDPFRTPYGLVCIVMNTEKVRNTTTGRVGIGYYILVVEETADPGRYERLGIGIAVSQEDRLPHGYFGRKCPGSKLTLV